MDESREAVSIDMIIDNLKKNVETSKSILKNVLPELMRPRTCACRNALENAIITKASSIPADTKRKLKLIIGKYIK